MELGLQALSKVIVWSKYAKYIPELKRRETWNEIIDRYEVMMMKQYPDLKKEIVENGKFIREFKVLPSMRALQFAGTALEVNNARGYNCCFLPIDSYHGFSETMFLLLGGTGVGYSVQKQHVAKLPEIKKSIKTRKYLVQDSIIGWADAVKVLMKSYFGMGSLPDFDFRDIRPKGARLITAGGKAPGPEPLKECLFQVQKILDRKQDGEKLNPLECHDILCHIANSVLAGGIRRSAMIALFSHDDEEMITCKYGNWWELNEQRGRANNSAVLLRETTSKEEFDALWHRIELSGSGEPGIYWTNDLDWGTNPCVTGDTEILTKEGYKEIQSLVGNEVEIWNGFEWSKVTPQITGYNQHMLKVTLSDGRELTSTDYHNWILAEGYTGKNKKVKSKDLKIGDKLIKYNFPIIKEGQQVSFKHAYTQGFISAEGMDDYNHFWLYEPKYMCKDRLDIKLEGVEYSNVNGIKRKAIYYNDVYNEKSYVPFDWCLTSKIEWLSGLFDGDGTELIEGGLQLCSTDFNFLKDLQKLLSTLGVNSKVVHAQEEGNRLMPDGKGGEKEYFCQKSWRICIGAVQMQELKTLGLQCERMLFDKTPQRDASQFVKIVKIEDVGYAEIVYCFNEPNRNYGVFNGILTGQCVEIGLRPFQFCNLCEINVDNIESQEDLNERASVAAFFGTLQAGFTDFHYLRPIWKKTTEKDALLGIGQTGIGSGVILQYDLKEAADFSRITNEEISEKIGINNAARITCIKPSGTTSCVLGCSSGIHAWHNDYYLRTIRFGLNEDIAQYLLQNHPELCELDELRPHDTLCVRFPISAPEGSILRTEIAIDTLERVKKFSQEWIEHGYISGANGHNVSATISIDKNRWYYENIDSYKDKNGEYYSVYENVITGTPTNKEIIDYSGPLDEWEAVGRWMWENKDVYNGLSVLPYFGGSYKQAPFEDISKQEYERRVENLKSLDLTNVKEEDDNVQFSQIASCAGGACSVET